MSIKRNAFRRARLVLLAAIVSLTGLVPLLTESVGAAGQVQSRSIKMSDAGPGQTGVNYLVTFTPATSGAQSLVIDFCSNSSIIGGSCTNTPAGVVPDASSAGFTAGTNTLNWTLGSATTSTVKITKGTGSALGTSASSFTLTGVKNPTSTGSFWARIYTYSDTAYGAGTPYSSPTAIGNNIDYGGFALSTSTLINITATVMETLTFCVSKAAPSNGCTSLTTPNLTLGHGSPQVLDSTVADTDTAYTQISTNALNGAVVALKARNSCNGLSRDGGTTCPIPGSGGTPSTFGTSNVAEFGLNVGSGSGGSGTVAPIAPYSTASNYAMQTAVTGTYGDPIENTSSTACANVNSLLTFAAQANVTTPAGVYSANESLIATGTF